MLLIGMRCPYLEVVPGINQYLYTITSDGSLNITGKCGKDNVCSLSVGLMASGEKLIILVRIALVSSYNIL